MHGVHRQQCILLLDDESTHGPYISISRCKRCGVGCRCNEVSECVSDNHLRNVDLTCSLANEVDVDLVACKGLEDFSYKTKGARY